jgi:hypothetical protein
MEHMKLKIAALTIACLASAAANAEVLNFKFVGTVTQSLPMAPAGAKVTGSFSYDTSTKPALIVGSSSGNKSGSAAYQVPRSFTLKVNGHTIKSTGSQVDVVNNYGGNIEDSVSVYGLPMTLDGTLFSEGTFGIYLASGPNKTHVLRDTHLPERFVVKQFDGMNYGWVQANGASDGTLLAFVIASVKEVRNCDED